MSYYTILPSLDNKIVGCYPQVEKAIYHCDIWENEKFIDKVNFIKPTFEPITADAVLHKKAVKTDLISAEIMGFTFKLFISSKLKMIFESNKNTGIQFYSSSLIQKNQEDQNYWVLNPYEFDFDHVDFKKSDVYLMKNTFEKVEKLYIESKDDFIQNREDINKKGYPYSIFIEKLELIENGKDFLIINDVEGGVKYIVSEKLKKEIESNKCTGIEFMPSTLTLDKWLGKNGDRERIYGKSY